MKIYRAIIFTAWVPAFAGITVADPLNMTISGKAAEKIPLETLIASPDIPDVASLSLSLDGGKSAADNEVDALLPSEAALTTDSTQLPMPGFSAIPDAPFITQAVPYELERQRDGKLKKHEKKIRFTDWEFSVVDEHNVTWHKESGQGFPPNPLIWDGIKDQAFVLQPDLAYFSYLKLTAHGEPDRTLVGDSVRYLAFVHQKEKDTEIRFGERVYEREKATFSSEAKIYLDDLAQRLSQLISFYTDSAESGANWKVTLFEPENQQSLADRRKNTWKAYLEKSLGRNMPDDRFTIEKTQNDRSWVSIEFPRARPPLTDLALRGPAKASLDMTIEGMDSIVKISEKKEFVIVDLRHDRLFRPGSAYLRDAALPYLTQAISQVREKMGIKKEVVRSLRSPQERNGEKTKSNDDKKLLLRSYTQKLPDEKKESEEDPKLTATRSKVLFMLFAREGLTP